MTMGALIVVWPLCIGQAGEGEAGCLPRQVGDSAGAAGEHPKWLGLCDHNSSRA